MERIEGGGRRRFRRSGAPEPGRVPSAGGPDAEPIRPMDPLDPERIGSRSVPAAALAAVAESGLLFLPVRLAAVQGLGATAGPLASYPLFVALFVGGTALATRLHRSPAMPSVAAGVAVAAGIVQGGWLGGGGASITAVTIILALAVALRVVTLALRDWRDPIDLSFGWGAVLLLVEVFMASSAHAGWEGPLLVIVPVFFVASIASRARSVRLAGGESGPEATESETAQQPEVSPRFSLLLLAAFLGGVALLTALGASGGLLQALGHLVFPAAIALVVACAVVLGVFGQALASVAAKFHLNFGAALQRIAARFSRAPARLRTQVHPGHAGWLERLIGAVVLLALAGLVLWLIHRHRERPDWSTRRLPGRARVESIGRALAELPTFGRLIRRGGFPAEIVRRWYAEALLALEARGVAKPEAATPAEYLGDVGRAFPEARPPFEQLTRAYERVRYGAIAIDRSDLAGVRVARDRALAIIRRGARADIVAGEELDEPQWETP
jgi:hypothetical protein